MRVAYGFSRYSRTGPDPMAAMGMLKSQMVFVIMQAGFGAAGIGRSDRIGRERRHPKGAFKRGGGGT